MSTIIRMKNCISKIRLNHPYGNRMNNSDTNIILQQIFEWTKNGHVKNVNEFSELLSHARETISRNGKKPFVGTEDPEITMG